MITPKASALRKGRIVFYNDYASKRPNTPPCVTYSIYSLKQHETDWRERGGWWSVRVSDFDVVVKGPFASEAKSIRVAKQMGACHGCVFRE
jgi:hypothetical protein